MNLTNKRPDMREKISPHQGVLNITDPNFYQEIKNLESLLEFDCTIEIITNLTQLYTKAIEHYESLHDSDYILYKEKLTSLLRREDVKKLLLPEPVTVEPKKTRRDLSSERVIEKTLWSMENDSVLTIEKIQENLEKQNENFKVKLAMRKKKMQQNERLLAFEEGVERIMEVFVEEKRERVKAVKEKYSESLRELKKMKQDDVVRRVVEEIEREMNEEVSKKVEETESYKNVQIRKLKKKMLLKIG